ncbi:MAG: PAS domain S-box protein [Methanoregula sp.]|nr:PAS domain S-box protein [Methanoregula sp.]
MARELEEEHIRELLRKYPKGLTIEEVSKKLSLNRTTAAKYLNTFVLTGQADMRTLGSAKLFYLTTRVPLTNVLSLSSDLILILDSDQFIQESNAAFLAYFRMSKEELKGSQLAQSPLAPHFSARELSSIERALDGEGGSLEVQFDLLHDGRFFKMKCIPLTFDNGARAVGIILEDITEMKTYQHELEQRVKERTEEVVRAKDFAENLISTANALIIGLDTRGNITIFNKAAEEATGYTQGEVLGKNWFETIVPKDRYPEALEEFRRLAIAGIPKNFENHLLTKSGSVRYISWNNNTIVEGRKIIATISFGIDITDKKRAEEQLKESRRALETLMGNLPGMAYRCRNDSRWTMEFVSEGCGDLTGYPPSDLIENNSVVFADLIHPEDQELVRHQIHKAVQEQQKFQVMYRILTAAGTGKWVWEQGLGVYSSGGDLLAIEGFVIDITDRKNAEEIIKKANKQVALLTSITRHDIINQINSLKGYIAIVKRQVNDEKISDLMKKEEAIADTILRQIIFTRDYQNVGAEPPRWLPVKGAIATLMQTIDKGSITITADTGNLEIYADPLIEKVFFNLIDNSLRHGEHVTRISISCEQEGKDLLLAYADDGVGIPDGEKEKIFTRGFGKNTGYGLFLIREILSITGFSILESGTSGKGARFVIRIPPQSYRFPTSSENSPS